MHRALASPLHQSLQSRQLVSSTFLKRPIGKRLRKTQPQHLSARSSTASTLAFRAPIRNLAHGSQLSWSQIQSVMASAALPMVGFGFMDNFVMIQAGSLIDNTLGVKFGLATLTAAAMGQVISDVSGVLFGGTLERFLSPWVKPANLTAAQKKLALVHRLRMAGSILGVIVGCTLGASALLFTYDSDCDEQLEKQTRLLRVVQDLKEANEMEGLSFTVHLPNVTRSIEDGHVAIVGLSKTNSKAIQCAQERRKIYNESTVHVPVIFKDGTVAVLELGKQGGFTVEESNTADQMTKNIGIFMQHLISD